MLEIDWTQSQVKLTSEQRTELLGDDFPAFMPDGVEVVSDTIVDHRRWTVVHEIVFKVEGAPDGLALRGFYEVGATESQEIDGDGFRSTFTIMVQEEVTRKEWRPKDNTLR